MSKTNKSKKTNVKTEKLNLQDLEKKVTNMEKQFTPTMVKYDGKLYEVTRIDKQNVINIADGKVIPVVTMFTRGPKPANPQERPRDVTVEETYGEINGYLSFSGKVILVARGPWQNKRLFEITNNIWFAQNRGENHKIGEFLSDGRTTTVLIESDGIPFRSRSKARAMKRVQYLRGAQE